MEVVKWPAIQGTIFPVLCYGDSLSFNLQTFTLPGRLFGDWVAAIKMKYNSDFFNINKIFLYVKWPNCKIWHLQWQCSVKDKLCYWLHPIIGFLDISVLYIQSSLINWLISKMKCKDYQSLFQTSRRKCFAILFESDQGKPQ